MPRLKEKPMKYLAMHRLLKSYGLTGPKLSKILECSHCTAKRRIDNPGHLTLDELVKINHGVPIPWEEIKRAIVQ